MSVAPKSLIGAFAAALFFGSGCAQQYKQAIPKIVEPYEQGLYAEAASNAAKAREKSEKDASRNRLIFLLEEGSTERSSAQLTPSTAALDQADKMFAVYDTKAKVQLGREFVSVATDAANVDYEGYGYDRIMMEVYKSLNYLQQGQTNDARIEIRRIQDAQQACEQRYQEQIRQAEQAKREAASKQSGQSTQASFDYNKAKADPKFNRGQQEIFGDFPEVNAEPQVEDLSHKKLYDNPYAEYLQGLFYLHSNVSGDKELGRVAITNALGMVQANSFLVRDADMAKRVASTRTIIPQTYVLFETGMAPKRDEIRIDIPVFLYNVAVHDTKVDYVAIAFPRLRKVGNNYETLLASTSGGEYRTELLADMDKIVAREFKNELPAIITRAVVSMVVKVGIQYAAAEATRNQDAIVQFAARGAASLYTAATNEADLRTWRTLPKQVQLASFPTPADGVVKLHLPNGLSVGNVTVQPGKSNIIWVRSPSTFAQPVVRTFPLN